MTLEDPKDIQAGFSSLMERLRTAVEPLSPKDQHSLRMELVPAFNYLSRMASKKDGLNLLYGMAANQQRTQEMLAIDHANLEVHREFVSANFQSADAYLKTIQLAGYAAYFAIWAIANEWLSPAWSIVSCLLMLLSAGIFLAWEVFKSSLLVAILRRQAGIALAERESRLLRLLKSPDQEVAFLHLARWRAFVWRTSLPAAVAAVAILASAMIRFVVARAT